jgi:hypothetical protein
VEEAVLGRPDVRGDLAVVQAAQEQALQARVGTEGPIAALVRLDQDRGGQELLEDRARLELQLGRDRVRRGLGLGQHLGPGAPGLDELLDLVGVGVQIALDAFQLGHAPLGQLAAGLGR